jgi:hypothetical protein
MNCKYCGADLPAALTGGHRQREFCDDKHRQAYWRQQHYSDQAAALVAELEALRAKCSDQARKIDEMASELDEQASASTWSAAFWRM